MADLFDFTMIILLLKAPPPRKIVFLKAQNEVWWKALRSNKDLIEIGFVRDTSLLIQRK